MPIAECDGCDGRQGLKGAGFEFCSIRDVSTMLRVSYQRFQRRVNKFRCDGLCVCDATRAAVEDFQREQKQEWKG